jgi:hypothetical protein
MAKRYDPLSAPKPEEWLDEDEDERLMRVERYHKAARLRLPNVAAHAVFHVVVENQAALGAETPVAEAIARLISEGLDRHDAIHAVGAVFANIYFEVAKQPGGREAGALQAAYFDRVRALTAARWREAREPE